MANLDFCSTAGSGTSRRVDWTLGAGKVWTIAYIGSATPVDLDGHTLAQVSRVLAAAAQPDAATFDNPKQALEWLNMP